MGDSKFNWKKKHLKDNFTGGYNHTFSPAHWQAKFYLPWQFSIPSGHHIHTHIIEKRREMQKERESSNFEPPCLFILRPFKVRQPVFEHIAIKYIQFYTPHLTSVLIFPSILQFASVLVGLPYLIFLLFLVLCQKHFPHNYFVGENIVIKRLSGESSHPWVGELVKQYHTNR